MQHGTTLVHVTHEAVCKVGGIGAVLQGFFTSKSYLEAVDRSILVGPLFSTEKMGTERLGDDGTVLYSSLDRISDTEFAQAFEMIEDFYGTNIIYGIKNFFDKQTGVESSVEVLLFDVCHMHNEPVNDFKRRMYDRFGICSDRYEHIWECEQYVRMAPAAISALKEIGAGCESTTLIAHEFMGMPTILAGKLDSSCDFKTIFYAHEVATMRRLVEKHPAHDTMFYNALEKGEEKGYSVAEVFGDQSWYFKHAYVDAAKFCNTICAVGDYVAKELRFMSHEFADANIKIVYNGIPSYKISSEERQRSQSKLKEYCENLLGYRPDYIFTHVTRLVTSKGLWRDLEILEKVEKHFRQINKSGVFFLLSTQVAQRGRADVLAMEKEYGWPVSHREHWPDLSGGEAEFYTKVQQFNASSRNIKVIFINQFGFNQSCCGSRMSSDMETLDIRKGSDVEFGLSIYEPFGIAQLEPLTFGGVCVLTNVCGCAGFVRDVTSGGDFENVVIADYTDLNGQKPESVEDAVCIDKGVREQIEEKVSSEIASKICSLLTDEPVILAERLKRGYEAASKMSWDSVVKRYLLDCLDTDTNVSNDSRGFSYSLN